MDILPLRDLVKDEIGNIYVVTQKGNDSLILVNAQVYYSFNRILSNDFVEEVQNKYQKSVAVGQFFTDIVKNKLQGFLEGRYPGKVYLLSAVKEHYDVVVEGVYERDVNIKR